MKYEKADGRYAGVVDDHDPVFRSYRRRKEGGEQPKRKAVAKPSGQTVKSTIEFVDPDWWRCDLALRRERLAQAGGG